jgi:hypothetical protein
MLFDAKLVTKGVCMNIVTDIVTVTVVVAIVTLKLAAGFCCLFGPALFLNHCIGKGMER